MIHLVNGGDLLRVRIMSVDFGRGCLARSLCLFMVIISFLDEVVELIKVEEGVCNSMGVMLLVDEVVGVKLSLLHLLLVVLTHQLSKSTVEFTDIVWEQLSIPKDLQKKLFLVLLANESPLDSHTLISNLLPTVIEDLLCPDTSLLLLFVPLDLKVALIEVEFANLAMAH